MIIVLEVLMDLSALFKISYGLYVLTASENGKDNGCIVNTVSQVTDNPNRISVIVNKLNYTHDMIMRTGKFNVSCLTEETPFTVFQHSSFVAHSIMFDLGELSLMNSFNRTIILYI